METLELNLHIFVSLTFTETFTIENNHIGQKFTIVELEKHSDPIHKNAFNLSRIKVLPSFSCFALVVDFGQFRVDRANKSQSIFIAFLRHRNCHCGNYLFI